MTTEQMFANVSGVSCQSVWNFDALSVHSVHIFVLALPGKIS
jgi:hypothetical protein